MVIWYRGLGRWILKVRDDPNACITAFSTLGILAFTIVLACVSNRQWRIMGKQLAETRREFEILQRPYVSLGREDGTLMEFKVLKPGQQAIIAVYFRNSGNSPAQNFFADGSLTEVKRHRLAPQLTPQTMYPGFRGTPLAARSQRTEIVLSLNVLTADDIIQIKRAGGVYGRFEYTDPILKRTCCQSFCVSYFEPADRFIMCPEVANSCPVTAQYCE
jgi:hypothetical protein